MLGRNRSTQKKASRACQSARVGTRDRGIDNQSVGKSDDMARAKIHALPEHGCSDFLRIIEKADKGDRDP
jgi:hypothetical protein